jgi:TnpA family transposase
MAGTTHSRYLSPEQAELARQQIEQEHKFREQVEQYREACEQWADAQLQRSQAASTGAAEKGGSKPTFKTKSSGKSKHS